MNRHLALTFAGAAAIVVTTVSGAVAANVGLLNVGAEKPVGQLTAANVAELASPDVTRAAAASAPVTIATVEPTDPATDGAPREDLSSPRTTPKSGSSAGAGVGTSSVGSSGSASPVTAPQGAAPSTPSVTAPAPKPSPTTTSRSSKEKNDDHEDEIEHEVDDDD